MPHLNETTLLPHLRRVAFREIRRATSGVVSVIVAVRTALYPTLDETMDAAARLEQQRPGWQPVARLELRLLRIRSGAQQPDTDVPEDRFARRPHNEFWRYLAGLYQAAGCPVSANRCFAIAVRPPAKTTRTETVRDEHGTLTGIETTTTVATEPIPPPGAKEVVFEIA